MEKVLRIAFLASSNVDIQFYTETFTWRSYSAAEALPTTWLVELIDKHKFAKAVLNKISETFVIHVIALEALKPALYPSQALLLAALQQDKTPIEIPLEYANYADVFSPNLAMKLSENIGINEHAIEQIEGEQLSYGPIYSLGPMELETLKAYIETNLKTGFIWPSKFSTSASIIFDKKSNSSLCLCVNY